MAAASSPDPLRQQLVGMGKTGTRERCRGFNPFICHEAIGGGAPELCAGSGAGSVLTPSAPVLKGLCSPRSLDTPGQPRPLPAHAQGGDGELAPRRCPNAELPAAGQRFKHTHGIYPDRASVPGAHSAAGRDRLARPGSAPHGHTLVMAGRGCRATSNTSQFGDAGRRSIPFQGLHLHCACPCPSHPKFLCPHPAGREAL